MRARRRFFGTRTSRLLRGRKSGLRSVSSITKKITDHDWKEKYFLQVSDNLPVTTRISHNFVRKKWLQSLKNQKHLQLLNIDILRPDIKSARRCEKRFSHSPSVNAAGGSFSKVAELVKLAPNMNWHQPLTYHMITVLSLTHLWWSSHWKRWKGAALNTWTICRGRFLLPHLRL